MGGLKGVAVHHGPPTTCPAPGTATTTAYIVTDGVARLTQTGITVDQGTLQIKTLVGSNGLVDWFSGLRLMKLLEEFCQNCTLTKAVEALRTTPGPDCDEARADFCLRLAEAVEGVGTQQYRNITALGEAVLECPELRLLLATVAAPHTNSSDLTDTTVEIPWLVPSQRLLYEKVKNAKTATSPMVAVSAVVNSSGEAARVNIAWAGDIVEVGSIVVCYKC